MLENDKIGKGRETLQLFNSQMRRIVTDIAEIDNKYEFSDFKARYGLQL